PGVRAGTGRGRRWLGSRPGIRPRSRLRRGPRRPRPHRSPARGCSLGSSVLVRSVGVLVRLGGLCRCRGVRSGCWILLGGADRVALGLGEALSGGVEPGLTPVCECFPALPQGEGVLQRGGAAFEFTDYFDQLVAGLLVAEFGDIGSLVIRWRFGVHGRYPIID